MRHFVITIGMMLMIGGSAWADESVTFVSGVNPSVRPVSAPSVMMVSKDARWYQTALKGVMPPYPNSLRFLDEQGAWYTPFTEAGMTGRYDIRGWHQ